jgi:TFIIF-interacting CTD phosphatase-like protein
VQTEEGVYIKDLRIIANRDLKDIVIVDNAVYSFGFQLNNGIPIIPFYNDKKDEELLHLIYYINCLAGFDDIREQNRKAFQLEELENADINDYIDSFLDEENEEEEDDEDNFEELRQHNSTYDEEQKRLEEIKEEYSKEQSHNDFKFSVTTNEENVQHTSEEYIKEEGKHFSYYYEDS